MDWDEEWEIGAAVDEKYREPDPFRNCDDHRFDAIRYAIKPAPNLVTCRYCHKPGLKWMSTREGWRTAEQNGTIHKCGHAPGVPEHPGMTAPTPRQSMLAPRPEWAKPREETTGTYQNINPFKQEQKTMDYSLIHATQQNYVALEVNFAGSTKPYTYKAEASDNWKVGDHAVVLVRHREPAEQLQVVVVRAVHTFPLAKLNPHDACRWVVQRIDLSRMADREFKQEQMVEQLNLLNAKRAAVEAAETQRKMFEGVPGGSDLLAQFSAFGAAPGSVPAIGQAAQ